MAKRSRQQDDQREFIAWLNATVPVFPIAADYNVIPQADLVRDTQVYCPFHANIDTPSARLYAESNNLHCFVCDRDYGVYDFLTVLGGLSYADIFQSFGKDYDGHVLERLASHKHENQRSVLESAADDPRKKNALREFQRDILGSLLAGDAYRAWREGGGPIGPAMAEMDSLLTNRFHGYDYAEILRGA